MAEKIKLNVELATKLEETKGYISEIKKKGGFKKNTGAEQQVKNLMQELEALSKNTNPSLKTITRMNSLFKQLSETLIKAAGSVGITSKKFEELKKVLATQEKNLESARSKRGEVLKKGKVNKTTGRYELFTTYQDSIVAGSGVKNAKGKAVKTAGTFLKNFDVSGNVKEGAFQDPAAAKAIYDRLKQEQTENGEKLKALNSEIEQYQNAIKQTREQMEEQGFSSLASKLLDNKIGFSESAEGAKEDIHNAEDSGKGTNSVEGVINKQTSSLGRAFKQFTLYNIALRGVKTALREAVQTVKELDKELTEQAMVTGLTREQTYGLVKSYQDLALQVGATTKEIASVATEYMKQGKTIQDSLILTEAAVSAAKVARVSVGDSVNYLTTALNGFQLAASDAMSVSDKFAALAAASATDYDELAIALSKVASQANLAGMSIDYTTALLTKGLETTREAPETMGTALKTIIARMRELSDYGETLEGDTDINNVETQLSYVGIALRNTNGELRSTEDVLDELGKKWDTLDKNQQAAVAKALAGTRQQSRLIAMMSDYERVIELQEISTRSAGTTAAQASVYLEGIEASLNKINVAWEKIIMSITDSEVIINFLSMAGGVLDHIGDFLSTDFGLVATLGTVATLGAAALGNKMREIELSKIQQQYNLEQQKIENEKHIQSQKALVITKKEAVESVNSLIRDKESLKIQKKKTIELAKTQKMKAEEKGNMALAAKYGAIIEKSENNIKEIDAEISKLKNEDLRNAENELAKEQQILHFYEEQKLNLQSQESFIGSISTGILGLKTPLLTVIALWKTISMMLDVVRAKQDKNHKKTMWQTAKETYAKATASAAAIIKDLGVWGIPIAIAVVAALAGATLAIGSAVSKAKTGTDGTADSINQLSTEIYKLNEKATAIGKITSAFEDLDNKIIKTKTDLEEMNSLLDQGAESLSTETYKNKRKAKKAGEDWYGKDFSEQDFYNSLSDNDKIKFLQAKEQSLKNKIDDYRQQQIKSFYKLSSSEQAEIMSDTTTNSDYLKVQSAFRATATDNAYKYIDSLKLESGAVEELTVAIIDELSAWEALDMAKNPGKVEALVDSFKNLRVEGNLVADVLSSDDFDIVEKTRAFKEMEKALQGNAEALEAFQNEYKDYQIFAKMSEDVLSMIEYLDLSADEINNLYSNINKTLSKYGQDTISEEYFTKNVLGVLSDTGNNIQKTIDYVFGTYLNSIKDYEDAYNEIVNSFSQAIATGALNMGQNTEKLGNQINSFYSKASEWSTMSESDKTEFINSNADLFKGKDGESLYRAFESGDYREIEQALKGNKVLNDNILRTIEDIDKDLSIEMAKTEGERNKAYIKYLQDWKVKLQDQTNIFKSNL